LRIDQEAALVVGAWLVGALGASAVLTRAVSVGVARPVDGQEVGERAVVRAS
jgi:hypothetical protein